MKNNKSIKLCLSISLTILFIFLTLTPMTIGYNINSTTDKKSVNNSDNFVIPHFDKYFFPETYSSEKNRFEFEIDASDITSEVSTFSIETVEPHSIEEIGFPTQAPCSGPMDSPWPMHGHDCYHTGRSPYSTASNTGFEKWKFNLIENVKGSPVIDDDGVIYIGASHLFAVYPNGTLKWEYNEWIETVSAPAIDENGVLYVGSIWAMPNYLYAIYTSNSTLKWKYFTGDSIYSSPAIGEDGTIYFAYGSGDVGYIDALYPNGTLKWSFQTGLAVYSSPAIGLDGTIFCGSHDNYVYALYPDNGTVKWKFDTGSWVHGIPTIGTDGTVYIGSDSGYLYAFYPNNGTIKWQCSVGSMFASPALDEDGTLYFGVWEGGFYAVYPNGTIKWSFDLGDQNGVWDSSAAVSAEGTIYFGMCYDMGSGSDGDIIALNPDGTERWRKGMGRCFSSPAIGEDGTVYIGDDRDVGYLHSFGPLDPNAPSAPNINGPTSGKAGTSYEYRFKSTSPVGRDVYYYVDWGDGTVTDWFGPNISGDEVTLSHTWSEKGTYTIKARVKDTDNLWGPWGELTVTMPRNKVIASSLFLRFLERFPLLERLLSGFNSILHYSQK